MNRYQITDNQKKIVDAILKIKRPFTYNKSRHLGPSEYQNQGLKGFNPTRLIIDEAAYIGGSK